MQSISPINSTLLLSFDNKNLKTSGVITGKTLNIEKDKHDQHLCIRILSTTSLFLIDHLKITENPPGKE
jgi:hypothetical protein